MKKYIDTPIKRFIRYGTWKHPFNYKEIEVKFSIAITILIMIFLTYLQCYENIELFREAFKNITIYIASAFIGVLGFILAGIAMMTSMLNADVSAKIERAIKKKGAFKEIFCSFEFIAFIVSILIVVLFVVYFSFFSNLNILNKNCFYILCAVLVYLIVFVFFYLFALIGNCIQLFYITNDFQRSIDIEEKQFQAVLNEVRIDFIITKMNKEGIIAGENFFSDLITFLNQYPLDNKEEMIEYFKQHYNVE